MTVPQIIIDAYDGGIHNSGESVRRVREAKLYEDQSTICLIPTRGKIAMKIVHSWWQLQSPMNQMFHRVSASGYEVGDAYSAMIDQILVMPGLSDFKYILTLEEDNAPPPDGLLRLIEAMNAHPEYDAIGGLYWTKGIEGQPMIYGNPRDTTFNFRPQPPVPGEIVECNGLGMGFTLFRMDLFRDETIPRPWFETVQDARGSYTQDLKFFEAARKAGHRFACHCGVAVGHYDADSDTMW